MPDITVRKLTIAAGAALSDAANIGDGTVVGIYTPTGWTAANITVQASHDGSAWFNVHDNAGTEVSISAAADRFNALDPDLLMGAHLVRLRSGTNAVPVNQVAARTLRIATKPI